MAPQMPLLDFMNGKRKSILFLQSDMRRAAGLCPTEVQTVPSGMPYVNPLKLRYMGINFIRALPACTCLTLACFHAYSPGLPLACGGSG